MYSTTVEPNCTTSLGAYPSLGLAFERADAILLGSEPIPKRLEKAIPIFEAVDTSELPAPLREDFLVALDAMRKAAHDDLSGVAQQYLRLVNTTLDTAQGDRLYFTVWSRFGEEGYHPCLLLCRVNVRNLELLKISRSRPFVETLVKRLGATTYPDDILSSRMQGIEVKVSAGKRPHVLFADFVAMNKDCGIDPATAGGLLFSSFGDLMLDQMTLVEKAFPNVAEWLHSTSLLNTENIRLLTTAHVQAHDLCGHSVPYNLNDSTRVQADLFLRGPLEEYYADTQAMWTYSSVASTRPFFNSTLSETELDAIPVLIAMKRLTFYAMKDGSDHDARCSWMMWGYWRKSGLIRKQKGSGDEFYFDLDRMPAVVDQMLSDINAIEHQIGHGVAAYETACRRFSERYGYESPVTNRWEIPDELGNLLFG